MIDARRCRNLNGGFNRFLRLVWSTRGVGNGSAAACGSQTLSDCPKARAASQTVRRPRSAANGRIGLQAAVQIVQATGSARPFPVGRDHLIN